MSKNGLATVPAGIQESVQTKFGFPDNCHVLRSVGVTDDPQGANTSHMVVVYHGDPTAGDFINAPIGTLVIDTENFKLCMKVAAAGTDTWKKSAAMT